MKAAELLSSEDLDNPTVLNNLTFEYPWAARIFAVTLALAETRLFTLKEFQQALIESISSFEKTNCIDGDRSYYSLWIKALVALLESKNVMSDSAILAVEARIRAAVLDQGEHRHNHPYSQPTPTSSTAATE